MADLGNQKIKDTYQLVLQTDASGNLQNLSGGTPTPFIVNGNLRYVDGNQALNYVLTSNAAGDATWEAPGHSTSYWSANTDGSITPSGFSTSIGIGTSTPNVDLTIAGSLSATGISTLGDISVSTQYLRYQTSNRIFLSSNPSGTPNILYDYWGMMDNDHFYWGTGEDLDVYHTGSHGYIDNDTGSLFVTSSALYLGDTTSETTVQDNLTVNDDLTVNTNSLYVSSTSGITGVGTLNPTHKFTVSGGTSSWIDWNDGDMTEIVLTNSGDFLIYQPEDLDVPAPLRVGGTTVRVLVDGIYYYGITTAPFFSSGRGYWGVEWALGTIEITDDVDQVISYGGDFAGDNLFGVYNGPDIALQVSGSTIMSGSTDLLDIMQVMTISGGTF